MSLYDYLFHTIRKPFLIGRLALDLSSSHTLLGMIGGDNFASREEDLEEESTLWNNGSNPRDGLPFLYPLCVLYFYLQQLQQDYPLNWGNLDLIQSVRLLNRNFIDYMIQCT